MKKNIIIIIVSVIVVAIVAMSFYVYSAINFPASKNNAKIDVEITEGQTTAEIAQILKSKGLIRSPFIFRWYCLYANKNILPGIYLLQTSMNAKQILDTLSVGNINETKVTIPEGYRATQIAQTLADKGLVNKDEFITKTKDLEGHLFPDTYRIQLETSVSDIIKKMTDNFFAQTASLTLNNDKLILASIVEREAKKDEDRAKIAGVYQNRLDIGMKLDSDPTVQYAVGNWEPLTVADLEIDSPYNTYIYKNLPPTPICNPGIKSIKAALNPTNHDFYYFFSLKDGTTIYSKTLEEQNENLIKYQDKL